MQKLELAPQCHKGRREHTWVTVKFAISFDQIDAGLFCYW